MAPSARAIALKGLFAESYDRFKLPTSVVEKLVNFFDGRGETATVMSELTVAGFGDWLSVVPGPFFMYLRTRVSYLMHMRMA